MHHRLWLILSFLVSLWIRPFLLLNFVCLAFSPPPPPFPLTPSLELSSMLSTSLQLLLLSRYASSMLLGWVESPGYPSGYLPHASLNWSRCAPKGHVLSIRLIHLDLEDSQDCENDAVKVRGQDKLLNASTLRSQGY